MSTEHLDASRLYALIGEPAKRLPDDAFAKLERALTLQEREPQDLAIRTIRTIRTIRNRRMIAMAGEAHALDARHHHALGTILEILHSAQQARDDENRELLLDDRLLEGLFVAGRLILDRELDH